MNTYIFVNDGLPGVRISIDAVTEQVARDIMEERLEDVELWLVLDTVHEWTVDVVYSAA